MAGKRVGKLLASLLVLALAQGMLCPGFAEAAAAGGYVKQASGNHEKWIDRLDAPEYAIAAYNALADESFWLDDSNFSENGKTWVDGLGANAFFFSHIEITGTEEEFGNRVNSELLLLRALYDALDRDHPEIFWLEGSAILQYTAHAVPQGGVTTYYADVYILLKAGDYDIRKAGYRTAEAIREGISLRDGAVNGIMSGVDAAGTEYQKVRYFNKWLTKNNEYNSVISQENGSVVPEYAWECLSALSGSEGSAGPACEGYSRAFKVLCDRAGISCTLESGIATNSAGRSESHMWNYVKLDGAWYAVDVTWNDPVAFGGTGRDSGYETEEYLCVGADTLINGRRFIDTHPVGNEVSGGGPGFSNGPVLNDAAYDPAAALPGGSYSDPHFTEEPGDVPSVPSSGEASGTRQPSASGSASRSASGQMPRARSILEHKGNRYKVTSSAGTAEFIGIAKNRAVVSIPAKIVVNGISYSVTSVSDKALKGNKRVKKVIIGGNVNSIGKRAFFNCKKLKKITILPLNVKIGKNAFYGINGKGKILVPEKRFSAYKKAIRKSKVKPVVKIVKR